MALSSRRTLALALLPITVAVSSCLVAAGAAAGSGIYFTTRGVESIMQGSVDQVTGTVTQAFERLGVRHKGRRDGDSGREIYGLSGGHDVTVELRRETAHATRVEVRVRKSAVAWDKEMAKRILEEIDSLRG
ncbi:MAG: DUF3568 family protein [Gemmatimonadota bacterium]